MGVLNKMPAPDLSKLSPDEKAQFLKFAKERIAREKKKESIGVLDAFSANLAQGATFGSSDELMVKLGVGNQEQMDERLDLTHEKYPVVSAASEALGSIIGGPAKLTGTAFARLAGAGLGKKVLGTGAIWAAEGAATAAGKAKKGEAEIEGALGSALGLGSGLTTNMLMNLIKNTKSGKLISAAAGALGKKMQNRAFELAADMFDGMFKKAKSPEEIQEIIKLTKIPINRSTSFPEGIPITRLEEGGLRKAIPFGDQLESSIVPSIETGVLGQPRVIFPGSLETMVSKRAAEGSRAIKGATGTSTNELKKASREIYFAKLLKEQEEALLEAVKNDPTAIDVLKTGSKGFLKTIGSAVPKGGFELRSPGTAATVGGLRAIGTGLKAGADVTRTVAAAGTGGTKDAVSRAGGSLYGPIGVGIEQLTGDDNGQ